MKANNGIWTIEGSVEEIKSFIGSKKRMPQAQNDTRTTRIGTAIIKKKKYGNRYLRYTQWTEADKNKLFAMRQQGNSLSRIAKELHRTRSAVGSALYVFEQKTATEQALKP
jgi:hypothetical protein